MNRRYLATLILCCCGASCASVKSDVYELATLLEGSFDSHYENSDLPASERMIDSRIRLDIPRLGEFVFYQQINQKAGLDVYRQRILVLVNTDSGIQQHAYKLTQPDRFIGAVSQDFASLTDDDLDLFMPDGCELTWTRTASGFRGYVDPKQCVIISSRTGKPRRIESETILTAELEALAERGFDADSGKLLFGSAPGEMLTLRRRP